MITIHSSKCTRCYRCVKICSPKIFSIADDQAVQVKQEHRCIRCGHCVAACEAGAVAHEVFPPEKIHAIDFSKLPTPEQTLWLIRKRRSNRAFSTQAIPPEFFTQILEAAHRAPTASNSQMIEFTLITDPEKLNQITLFAIETFMSSIKLMDNFLLRGLFKRFFPLQYKYVPMVKNIRQKFLETGKDIGILRGATAVLLIHTPKSLLFDSADCNLAYQNASLMAESLGVSQFYTGLLLRAYAKRGKRLEKILGIKGKIYAGMAMAMPLFECVNYVDKADIAVNKL